MRTWLVAAPVVRRVAVVCLLGAASAGAQDSTRGSAASRSAARTSELTIPEFAKLRTPTTPAFFLLGLTTTTAEAPRTPRAVAVSLLNAFTGQGQSQGAVGLPKQFALEVAPYWLRSRPQLTVEDYSSAGPRTLHNVGTSIARTLSIAVATHDSSFQTAGGTSPHDTSVFRLAGSVRFAPFRGRVADTNCVRRLRRERLDPLARYIALGIDRLIRQSPESASDSAAIGRAELRLRREWQAQNSERARELKGCADVLSARTGFQMDVAAGMVGAFPAQTFDRGTLAGWALWATPTWAPSVRSSLVGVTRLGAEAGRTPRRRRYGDVGARGVWAWSQYAVALEGVWRNVREAGTRDDLYRATVDFDVKLGSDLWLNTAFGRDFRAKEARSVLALANLQWHFGDKPTVEVP